MMKFFGLLILLIGSFAKGMEVEKYLSAEISQTFRRLDHVASCLDRNLPFDKWVLVGSTCMLSHPVNSYLRCSRV